MKDVFKKSVYGVGYLGFGTHKTRFNNKATKTYVAWKNMMFRCYGNNRLKSFPTYVNCFVCEEWHNFQNFSEWFNSKYVEGYHMDKDLLFKDNNIYGPSTCVFIPQEINKMLTKTDSKRGEYPIGVFYNKNISKFTAQICIGFKKRKFLGNFNNCNDAFFEYKKEKENIIKETAEKYRDAISEQAYVALLEYKVNITD